MNNFLAALRRALLALILGTAPAGALALTPQTITFGPLPDRVLGSGTFTVTATASSGLAVMFTSTTMGVCEVTDTTVTLIAAGTCTLAAIQPGDATYESANALGSFKVFVGTQVIDFAVIADRVYGAAPFTVSATGGASGNPVVFSSLTTPVCTATGTNGSMVTILSAGTCTIAANQAGNDNYPAATQVTRSFTVAKASQVIDFPAIADRVAGSAAFTVSATGGASGNPVVFSSLTPTVCSTSGANGTTVTLVSAGTCTIAANQAGTANYDAAAQVTQSFNIAGLTPQAIAFPAIADRVYGAAPFTVTATGGASGNPVVFTSLIPAVCTASGTNGSTITILSAGTCTVAANQAGGAGYEAATQVTRSFTIAKASQSFTFAIEPTDRVLSTFPMQVFVTASSSLPVTLSVNTPAVCSVTGTSLSLLAVGTCEFVVSQAGDANYLPAQVTRSFRVLAGNPAAFLLPPMLLFKEQPANTTSATQEASIMNGGNGLLSISSVTMASGGGAYTMSSNCAGAAFDFTIIGCKIQVAFRPPAKGLYQGQVKVSHNGPGGGSSLSLMGSSGTLGEAIDGGMALLGVTLEATGSFIADLLKKSFGVDTANAMGSAFSGLFKAGVFKAGAITMTPGQAKMTHAEFVSTLYRALFGRDADAEGLAYWTGLLDQGLPAANVVLSFAFGTEFRDLMRLFVNEPPPRAEVLFLVDLYRGAVVRAPDQAGFDYWLARLRAAECTGAAAVAVEAEAISAAFYGSAEYAAMSTSNQRFVTDLYDGMFRRGADLAGFQYWVSQLAAGARRDDVRRAFVQSAEFRARVDEMAAQSCVR